ncbi:hypothetical protein LXL04_004232 [Taraxacum kok-saghyz]
MTYRVVLVVGTSFPSFLKVLTDKVLLQLARHQEQDQYETLLDGQVEVLNDLDTNEQSAPESNNTRAASSRISGSAVLESEVPPDTMPSNRVITHMATTLIPHYSFYRLNQEKGYTKVEEATGVAPPLDFAAGKVCRWSPPYRPLRQRYFRKYGCYIKTDSSSSQRSFKTKPYSKHDHYRVNAPEEEGEDEEFPKIIDYCFSVDVSALFAMQVLGDKARWPRKGDKANTWKDKSKWCAYHEDFDHITEDCIAFRKEISYLLSKGHLKELLGRKKDRSMEREQDPSKILQKSKPPPSSAHVINMISGGSDICGTSYLATRTSRYEDSR